MILDDVIHAFGLVNHETLRAVLLPAGVHPILTDLILNAVQHLTLHHGVRLFEPCMRQAWGKATPFLPFCAVW